ncbi:lantibiotic dehydratase [Streptomyces xanthophaeus]|uniref:Lantibiotic dehydratase n=1 Tax=Streptomyces xanthophaeus TaxID=67385 RepID=A0A919GRI9_9ACTN|nr:lantibiotic dehydratase [Streptomyces xanthophaeus]GHI82858.1 lantibiotic dehydratase [Streptomyces xanthophaeus]
MRAGPGSASLRATTRWTSSEFFILRTPLLPLEDLLALGEDLRAPDADGQADATERALSHDRRLVRSRLADLCGRPEVREALFLASPSLAESVNAWLRDPDSRRGRKTERALYRYISRMAARPTPFGLLAGWTTGRVDASPDTVTSLSLGARSSYRRRTQISYAYVSALSEALRDHPSVRNGVRFHPNSTLYQAAGRVRYIGEGMKDGYRTHHLFAVAPSAHLFTLLKHAASGARRHELVAALRAEDSGITDDDAGDFVDQLIDHQVLVPELGPSVCGPDAADQFVRQLKNLPDPGPTTGVADGLITVRDALAALGKHPLGTESAVYRRISSSLPDLPPRNNGQQVHHFHTDLIKPACSVVLGADVTEEILRGAHLLHRMDDGGRDRQIRRFAHAFRQRYGSREVPVCEALDEETGIGFPASEAPRPAAEPLLAGLAFAGATATSAAPTAERQLSPALLATFSDALRSEAGECEVAEADLQSLGMTTEEQAGPLPDSFSVLATLLARDERAVAAGAYRVLVTAVAGPSAMSPLGRLCHEDQDLTHRLRAHVRAEEALQPDAVFAEVVHVPDERVGDLLTRPHVRHAEIAVLANSGSGHARRIPLADLFVRVSEDQVVLASRRLGRRILPRLTSAHNFAGPTNLGLYRFLCALQGQGVTRPAFSFGALEAAPFLPRVTSGRLVLSPARWNVPLEELEPLAGLGDRERFEAVAHLRRRLRMPRRVALAESDRLLPVDFDNVLCVDSLVHHLVRRAADATFTEVFHGPDEVVVRGPEGRFTHDLIVPFIRVSETHGGPGQASGRSSTCLQAPTVARAHPPELAAHPPGSEWLYAKLYVGPAGADDILREVVRPVVRHAQAAAGSDKWFFIRYGDPEWHLRLRIHGDPRKLTREVLPCLVETAAPFLADETLQRLQLDSYEPEVVRYGGPIGMLIAERLFHADSEAVLDTMEMWATHGTEAADGAWNGLLAGPDGRWRLCLVNMDRILRGLGMSVSDRRAVTAAARDALAEEIGADRSLRRGIRERYRSERAALESLLRLDRPFEDDRCAAAPWGPALPLVGVGVPWSVVHEVACDLRGAMAAGRVTTSLPELAGNYLHLHANRLLRSAARSQEFVLYEFLHRLYTSRAARGSEAAR